MRSLSRQPRLRHISTFFRHQLSVPSLSLYHPVRYGPDLLRKLALSIRIPEEQTASMVNFVPHLATFPNLAELSIIETVISPSLIPKLVRQIRTLTTCTRLFVLCYRVLGNSKFAEPMIFSHGKAATTDPHRSQNHLS